MLSPLCKETGWEENGETLSRVEALKEGEKNDAIMHNRK